jgi:phospholipid/cholesterol/gamma-HCH transport system substrate-binding protein
MGSHFVETLVGTVVVVVAAVFLVFAYSTAGVRTGVGGYELVAKFDRVDGLNIGSDVRLSGIKIGSITRQELDPKSYVAVVHLNVDGTVKLPEDSAARIASEGLLGGNYLSLEPGGSEVMLKAGSEIKFTQGAVNLLDLIGQAIFGAAGGGAKPAEKQ